MRVRRIVDQVRRAFGPVAESHQTTAAPARDDPVAAEAPRRERWNLGEVEAHVQRRMSALPERVEEWRYTLVYLRAYAEVDGSLPESLTALVEDVFGEALVA